MTFPMQTGVDVIIVNVIGINSPAVFCQTLIKFSLITES